MNINQAQQLSGVSSDNIRFYEKQGLLCPRRNRANDYREYSEDDIRTLKLIRILRMLDMPLPQIRTVLAGDVPLSQAAQLQRQRLALQAQQLESAIRLCEEFSAHASLEALDVDGLLHQMDTPEQTEGFFRGWLQDYRRVALSEHEKRFTFVPDEAVTTPREFSNALFQYARENGLDLVITKEECTRNLPSTGSNIPPPGTMAGLIGFQWPLSIVRSVTLRILSLWIFPPPVESSSGFFTIFGFPPCFSCCCFSPIPICLPRGRDGYCWAPLWW